MKILKYLFLFGLVLISSYYSKNLAFAEEYTKVFRLSAYYSPLPCQDRYATGSYEGDIRLNGRGTNGASGAEVYPGMIAAPKSYPFGTKMYIPGYGIGTVLDRGGAIISADEGNGSFDRLDIWMGYGDVGLNRALNFGKRNLEVTVYGVDKSISDTFHIPGFSINEKIAKTCTIIETTKPEVKTETKPVSPVVENITTVNVDNLISSNTYGVKKDSLFYQGLMKGDNNAEVKRLQTELSRLNFYKVSASGNFDELTMHAVFKFQQSQGIVSSLTDVGAGYFGPSTRARLNEIITLRNNNNILIASKNLIAKN